MPITHVKVSAVSDGTDSAQVQPSDWNAAHSDTYADRASYSGNSVTIADGVQDKLTWDTLGAGAAVLDLTDPTLPTVVTAGIWAVTAVVRCNGFLTAGGVYLATLHLDYLSEDAVCEMTSNDQTSPVREAIVSLTSIYYIPAGGVIAVTIENDDGAASRDFDLREAILQRLS